MVKNIMLRNIAEIFEAEEVFRGKKPAEKEFHTKEDVVKALEERSLNRNKDSFSHSDLLAGLNMFTRKYYTVCGPDKSIGYAYHLADLCFDGKEDYKKETSYEEFISSCAVDESMSDKEIIQRFAQFCCENPFLMLGYFTSWHALYFFIFEIYLRYVVHEEKVYNIDPSFCTCGAMIALRLGDGDRAGSLSRFCSEKSSLTHAIAIIADEFMFEATRKLGHVEAHFGGESAAVLFTGTDWDYTARHAAAGGMKLDPEDALFIAEAYEFDGEQEEAAFWYGIAEKNGAGDMSDIRVELYEGKYNSTISSNYKLYHDYEKAAKLCEKKVREGCPSYLVDLEAGAEHGIVEYACAYAKLLSDGFGTKGNDHTEEIRKLWKIASDGEIAEAQFYHGTYLYENGDSEKGISLIEKSARQDCPLAKEYCERKYAEGDVRCRELLLTIMYYGYGSKIEYEKLSEMLPDLIKDGSMTANLIMGKFWEYGYHREKNYDEAIKYYSEAARLGSDEAAALIGNIYMKEDYSGFSLKKSLKLLSEAADKGNAAACLYLGYYYFLETKGKEMDYSKGKAAVYKSASLGYLPAMADMGWLHFNNDDKKNTGTWNEKGAKYGNASAISAYIDHVLSPDFNAQELGMDPVKMAKALSVIRYRENGKASAALGLLMYGYNRQLVETEEDVDEMIRRLDIGFQKGSKKCGEELYSIYNDGLYNRKNPELALKYAESSADAERSDK